MNDQQIIEDSIFKIGEVVSVDGRKVKIKVDKTKNSSHLLYNGILLKNISVGSYIKIVKGFTKIIAKVDGEFIYENYIAIQKDYVREEDKIVRVLMVSLLGYFNNQKFERGIKELPLVFNECFLLNNTEFSKVHDFIRKDDEPLEIGCLSLEKSQKIQLGVNTLFASHIGIFGNTGSGKSYTLARIYNALFNKYKQNDSFKDTARFYLFDFNGEYLDTTNANNDNVIIEHEYKNIYNLSTRVDTSSKFPISQDEVNGYEFWSIYLTATEKTQTPFLKRALESRNNLDAINSDDVFKSRIKEILYFLILNRQEKGDIIQFLNEINNIINELCQSIIADFYSKLNFHSTQDKYYYNNGNNIYIDNGSFKTVVVDNNVDLIDVHLSSLNFFDKVKLRVIFQYYYELANYNLNTEHINPLIKRLKKIDMLGKVVEVNATCSIASEKILNVISLKDVNVDMKKILPLLICKQIYDKKKQDANRQKYLNIIIDEAHNILSNMSERESQAWKDYRLEVFEEIIKEGRKFGVFMTIASQRPSDISPTIISQLHNYFLHRLINNKDIEAVEKTISYLDKVSFEYLPILPTGTCILAGLSAQVPVIIDIDGITQENEPRSDTISLVNSWQ